MTLDWMPRAAALADEVTHRSSRWNESVHTVPRHLFVPRWWAAGADGWRLRQGPADEERWLTDAYSDTSLVTRAGPLHADLAKPDEHPVGRPTSSSTMPSLTVRMLRHGLLQDGDELLEVGTGSGYGTALAARRLSSQQVTSVDVDPYLVETARDRLEAIGIRPTMETVDATAGLPWPASTFDRIVSTVAVRPVPASWLTALCVGGRLVTTISGTTLLITAEKTEDGGATGRVEWDRAGFMHTRHGIDYPPGAGERLAAARDEDGEDISTGRYPVVDVAEAWDLSSMLDLTLPGIEHHYEETNGRRTALMAHPDGSWARAAAEGTGAPVVHQGGPRRLWDTLDELRSYWLEHGELPVRGAKVFVTPDGTTHLARGRWRATL